MGLWLVQHVKMPGWEASAQLGSDLGGSAAEYARAVGYLPGAHLATDQEGCKSVGDPVIAFLEAWAKEATASGFDFLPLAYDGYAAGLTPEQFYSSLPSFHLYWADYGPRVVAHRGFAIKQHAQQQFPELPWPVDLDDVKGDQLGGRLRWMVDLDTYQVAA
jgi:hypothetical protein